MAEWKDVIHQLVRICKSQEGHCGTCVLSAEACPNSLRFNTNDEAGFVRLEKTVMSWAKGNPEPVYPKWEEWLADVGVLMCDTSFPNKRYWYTINKLKLEQPIPEDIAQKLGLEPKEIKNEIN